MEQNVVSLSDKISRAENYYRELCDYEQSHKNQCMAIAIDLMEVKKVMDAMYNAIVTSTRRTHVGAPQALEALQYTAARLNDVLELLKSDINYTRIGGDYGAVTDKTIMVTEGLAKRQRKLAECCDQITAMSRRIVEHASGVGDKDGLQSSDLTAYRNRAMEVSEKINVLSDFMAILVKYLAEAERLYSEAQVNAIARANQIPY